MKNRLNRKKKVAIAAGVAALLLASTFAYWTQTSTVENPFETSRYGMTMVEEFSPADGKDWQPGVTVDKSVSVSNTGDTGILVRAKVEETWTRKGESDPYKDSASEGYDVYTVAQDDAADGETADDDTVVSKNLFDTGATAKWIAGGDGRWFYYTDVLGADETTQQWLASVTLDAGADMGQMTDRHELQLEDGEWYAYADYETAGIPESVSVADGAIVADGTAGADVLMVTGNRVTKEYAENTDGDTLYGYSNSDYKLIVTTQTLQATADAVEAEWLDSVDLPAGLDWGFTVPTLP